MDPNLINQSINASSATVQNAAPAPMQSSMQAPVVSAPQLTSVVIGEDVINIYRLYEEHNLLRRRVDINEERLQELRATNTYLLQQNEQLRRQTTRCSCTNTIVNPVTLTTATQSSAATVNISEHFMIIQREEKRNEKNLFRAAGSECSFNCARSSDFPNAHRKHC